MLLQDELHNVYIMFRDLVYIFDIKFSEIQSFNFQTKSQM